MARAPWQPRKYRNRPEQVGSLHFDSQKEARRYNELLWLEKAGQISHLCAEKALLRWAFVVNGHLICQYEADFKYLLANGTLVIEDVKSPASRTREYQIKKKLLYALYGLLITEV